MLLAGVSPSLTYGPLVVVVVVCVADSAQCLSRWQVPGERQPAHSADQGVRLRRLWHRANGAAVGNLGN
jgi:hypothetical protein